MLLKANDLTAGYGRLPILHGLDFEVTEGEVVAVLGPNGAGKSTLMKALARVLPVLSGTIEFKGKAISSWGAAKAAQNGISYVPQESNVFPSLTVRENLQVSAGGGAAASARMSDVLDRLPVLADRSAQHAGTLSGGERQMLAIASALLVGGELLLLDEPTTGLAPLIVEQISTWIGEIAHAGMTVVWVVEQNPEPVLRAAARAYVLEGGQVHHSGPASAIAQDYLAELLLGGHT